MANAEKEKDFQGVAEGLAALEHARECDGEIGCPENCECGGTHTCDVGVDSEYPESWRKK